MSNQQRNRSASPAHSMIGGRKPLRWFTWATAIGSRNSPCRLGTTNIDWSWMVNGFPTHAPRIMSQTPSAELTQFLPCLRQIQHLRRRRAGRAPSVPEQPVWRGRGATRRGARLCRRRPVGHPADAARRKGDRKARLGTARLRGHPCARERRRGKPALRRSAAARDRPRARHRAGAPRRRRARGRNERHREARPASAAGSEPPLRAGVGVEDRLAGAEVRNVCASHGLLQRSASASAVSAGRAVRGSNYQCSFVSSGQLHLGSDRRQTGSTAGTGTDRGNANHQSRLFRYDEYSAALGKAVY